MQQGIKIPWEFEDVLGTITGVVSRITGNHLHFLQQKKEKKRKMKNGKKETNLFPR